MLKKLVLLLSAMLLSLILTVNCFAYTNMYTPTSGIPDFTEVTGARLASKSYVGKSTLYIYNKNGMSQESFDRFVDILYANGYIYFYNTSGPDMVAHGFLNTYKNMYIEIMIKPYASDIAIGISPYY